MQASFFGDGKERAIGEDYSFDENGEVVGLSNVVVEILPMSERTDENYGYRVLGGAPIQ